MYVTLYGYVDMYQDYEETGVFLYCTSDVEGSYLSASDALQNTLLLIYMHYFLSYWAGIWFILSLSLFILWLTQIRWKCSLKSSRFSARSHPYLFSKTTSGRHTLLKRELNNEICILLLPSASSLLITFSNLIFIHFSFCNFLILPPFDLSQSLKLMYVRRSLEKKTN